jgi:hypothetical protein
MDKVMSQIRWSALSRKKETKNVTASRGTYTAAGIEIGGSRNDKY